VTFSKTTGQNFFLIIIYLSTDIPSRWQNWCTPCLWNIRDSVVTACYIVPIFNTQYLTLVLQLLLSSPLYVHFTVCTQSACSFPAAWVIYWMVFALVGIILIVVVMGFRFAPEWTFYILCYIL